MAFLEDRLEKIGIARSPEEAEGPMHNFTCSLLRLREVRKREAAAASVFQKGDESCLRHLERKGAIPILLNAIDRFSGYSSPEFNNSACIAVVHFAIRSRERSRQILKRGGFGCLVRMMETYRAFDFVQIIAIAALMVVAKNNDHRDHRHHHHHHPAAAAAAAAPMMGRRSDPTDPTLEWTILKEVVAAMEYHQESAQLYVVACAALGSLLGPPEDGGGPGAMPRAVPDTEEGIELYHRAIDEICYGLVVLHLDDRVAQNLGKNLLCSMVGQQAAGEMMFHVENSYGTYAAAAA